MGLPVIVGLGNRKPIEEVAMTEKNRFQRRHAQGLSKPARPSTEEERTARIGDESIQMRGLVNVELIKIAQGFKVGDVGCDRFHDADIIAKKRQMRGGTSAAKAPILRMDRSHD